MKNLLIQLLFTFSILLLSRSSNADVTYVHNDMLGSPILETDKQGSVLARFRYKPFGETIESSNDDIGYTGHLNDNDLDLTYMQARYYDPVIGRFYSNDPVGANNVENFNRYAYGNNNPYKFTDPDGQNVLLIPPPPPPPPITLPVGTPPMLPPHIPSTQPTITLPKIEIPDLVDLVIMATAELNDIIQHSDRPEGIPDDWTERDSKRGDGKRYTNPDNDHDNVRSMPGNPNSPYPSQQNPYIKRQKNGQFVDKDGNPVASNSPEAHIPTKDFVFK